MHFFKSAITIVQANLATEYQRNLGGSSISVVFKQSSKLAGSPKSEASEIMLRTSETILALVRSD